LNLPTIELAGGSARCMLATIYLLLWRVKPDKRIDICLTDC